MNPFIFIITYGLFFTYNIFYFLLISENKEESNNNNFIKSNQTYNSSLNDKQNLENTTISISTPLFINSLKNNNNTYIISKKNNHKESYENKYHQNCYISDVIIHYKCESN